MATKKTVKKAPVKKADPVVESTTAPAAPAAPPAPAPKPQSKIVNYFFPKAKGASFSWNVGTVDAPKTIRVQAKNGVLILDGANKDHAFAIEKLSKNPQNKANGGAKFGEVKTSNIEAGGIGLEIDKFIEMDESAIIAVLGGDIELYRLTKGSLIAKALKLG